MKSLTSIPRDLKTRDLFLRRISMSDAKGMFAILSDPQSMKYWSDAPITNIEDAIKILQKETESDARGDSMSWAVMLNGHETMIGKCVLFQFSQANRRAEIGFILNREYWGRGLMRQALEAVINFAFTTLDLHRIEADVDPDNTASLGLLERLHFKREGLFHDRWWLYCQWQDSIMLGLLNTR